ncbi:MAG: hypothetical protein IPL53_23400 [Ignavibacteria bacterium]|nr:hypothetical protein [Ignavibacteria bacterium]
MKKFILSCAAFCMLFVMLITNTLSAQWFNSITTPDGTNIVAVGNAGKIYRSGSGGITYTSSSVVGSPTLKSVSSFGNDVWIAGQNGNVVKTLKTTAPNSTYNVGTSSTLNSITFLNSNTGYVCGDGGIVYKSVNGGVNWTLSNSGISGEKLNSINFKDSNTGTIAANNGVIYVTSDGGGSWSSQPSGVSYNLLKVKYFGNDIVAVGEYGTILLNTGSGWVGVVSRTLSDIRGISGTAMNDVHVCGGGGFIRNNKSGSSNFFNFEKNPMLANLVDIFFYNNNNGWAVSSLNNVIIYTTNGGTTWSMPSGSSVAYNWVSKTPSGSGIGNNLCKHPYDRNSMFVVYGKNVFASRDKGDSWTQIATISIGTKAHSFYVSPVDTNIWLAAMENTTDCIVRSTNYGATWENIIAYDFSTYGQPLEMDQNNPSTFYFAPSNGSGIGMFKSINNGASFSLIAPYNNSNIGQPCDIIVMWDSSNVIYLGDDGADIWKSINGGLNWVLVKPNSSSEVPSMCNSVFDKSICYATTWGGTQVYKTVNHGDSWSIVSNNSGSGWGSDLCHEDPSVVLTGNYGAQAYLSTNGGENFFNVNTGLSGSGAGMMVTERGVLMNMQTGVLFKLNIVYTDTPVQINSDVQSLSIGTSGVNYFTSPTIVPTGMVKNNNGAATATFTVTRKITPGNYVSTKTITDLGASSSTTVSFNPWTFNAGTTYTVRDSVYMNGDTDPGNDVITGIITPYVGESITRVSQGFTGTFPPASWTFIGTGTNYWQYNTASSYGIGVGSARYNFWSAPNGTNQSMVTPSFSPSIAGDSLEYDYAYAPYSSTVDSLIIESSTNGGSSYSTLVSLYGKTGASGNNVLNTVTTGGNFTPSAGQWLKKKWSLPAGTNKIKFRAVSGFGDNLYLDSIKVLSGSIFTQYNVTIAPEGFYNEKTLNSRDTVKAYLRNTVSPFAAVDSAVAVLDSVTLTAPFVFKNLNTGTYYIQIIHRNAVETWSKAGGESITKGITGSFDFTSSQSQTYEGNSVLVGTKWCAYSGDVVKDGVVDLNDVLETYNFAANFAGGYVKADLNGDGITDLSDIIIAYNNSTGFVTAITPMTSQMDLRNIKEKMRIDMFENSRRVMENISNDTK